MKKLLLMKTVLLLFALIVGSGSVWADVTYELVKNISELAQGDVILITSAKDGSAYALGNTQNNNNRSATSVTISSETISTLGDAQEVTLESKSGDNFTLKVGDNSYLYAANSKNGSSNYLRSKNDNAIYWSITVNTTTNVAAITDVTSDCNSRNKLKYNSSNTIYSCYSSADNNLFIFKKQASSDPSIIAANVNIASDATSGEIAYTISNPNGSTLTAAEKSPGYDWIDDVTVVSAQNKVTFTTTENTGAAREGYITLTYGSVTKDVKITQAVGVTKYTVTIETPTNGTLVVKRGDTPIATGAQIPDGTTLNIETTPANGYRLRNWQAVDGSTHTYTASFTYTINAHDVTIKANFEIIPEHTATFYINGTKDSEAVVKEGSAIAFPSISIAGQKFLGWTTAAIDGTQTTKPAVLVTEATMSTANVDYYAVFGGAINAYFDASDITDTPKDGSSLKWTHTATGIYISLSAGQHYTAGTPNTFTVTKGTTNFLQVTAPDNCILEKIVVTLSGSNYTIGSVQTGASLSTSGTTQTVTFSADKNSMRCYATKDYQIRATTIAVKALGYCTTIPTTTTPAVTSFGWATYIAENDMQFAEGDAYIVTDADFTDGLTIAEATSVSKGTPLLLKGEGAKTATLLATTPDALVANLLSVCNGTIADGKYAYVLAKNGANACFKQWTGTAATLNGRVVLLLDQAAAARGIFELDDDATGIKQVETSKQNAEGFYNLAGQRIAQPTKGLYIVNGKKVIIK